MRTLLATHLRTCDIDALDAPDGVAFIDTGSGNRLRITLKTDPANVADAPKLVVVHAVLADGSEDEASPNVSSGDTGSLPPNRQPEPTQFAWPNPWPFARRREATVLVNLINATRLPCGALTIAPESNGVQFHWAVPMAYPRDMEMVELAITVARSTFATFLPAVARVIIEGYPAAIALGEPPVHAGTPQRAAAG